MYTEPVRNKSLFYNFNLGAKVNVKLKSLGKYFDTVVWCILEECPLKPPVFLSLAEPSSELRENVAPNRGHRLQDGLRCLRRQAHVGSRRHGPQEAHRDSGHQVHWGEWRHFALTTDDNFGLNVTYSTVQGDTSD